MPRPDGAGPAFRRRWSLEWTLLIPLLGVGALLGPGALVVDAGMRDAESSGSASSEIAPDSAEARLGERLFFESRFAQYFFSHSADDFNASLPEGDPLVNEMEVAGGQPLPGPFRGQAMNCRQCHLGDDYIAVRPLAGRTYVDFSRRSRLPPRTDGLTRTPRNSPSMVDLGFAREVPALFHFDGEFADLDALILDTLTGRNLGWLPEERSRARAHAARIVRDDDGFSPHRVRYRSDAGIPYRVALAGRDPDIPESLRIPTALSGRRRFGDGRRDPRRRGATDPCLCRFAAVRKSRDPARGPVPLRPLSCQKRPAGEAPGRRDRAGLRGEIVRPDQ